MFYITYTKQALKDIPKLKSAHLDEGLLGNLQGFFSRRINIQHRLVYQVFHGACEYKGVVYEGTVKIVRMWTHYE